jgi:hypothetical protein
MLPPYVDGHLSRAWIERRTAVREAVTYRDRPEPMALVVEVDD